jgi:hypothetical protein
MHKSWPYIIGAAIFALTPVGPNHFAKGFWGIAPAEPTPADSGGVGPQGQYTPEMLAAREQYLAQKAHDEEWGVLPASQGPAVAPSASDRAEQIANAILSNPHATMRDVALASQILRGRASPSVPSYQSVDSTVRQGSYTSPPDTGLGYSYGPARSSVDGAYGAGPASVRGPAGTGYRGLSGTSYKYDLSDPGQQMRYEMDPMAQMHDSISIDPRRDIDRSIGQYGGGIGP